MMKLIATNDGWSLYQTGLTTVYEGTPAETVLPSGVAIDANDNKVEIPNLQSALSKAPWTFVADLELPTEKGRERKFPSRSEAARYAARVRWGNRGEEGAATVLSNGVPVEATFDINEAILTGKPYAPFLDENLPPEVAAALDIRASESGKLENPSAVDYAVVYQYYDSHMSPSKYSPEVVAQMKAVRASGKEDDAYLGDVSQSFYTGLATGDPAMRHDVVNRMTMESFKRRAQIALVADKGGEFELETAKAFQASPNKALTISIGSRQLAELDSSGQVLNQFATGSSHGYLNLPLRAAHESASYATHPATLPAKRPIYGNYHPAGVQHGLANGSSQYGDVQLVLKPEVHKRSTFTVIDSLGMSRDASPVVGPITRGQPHTSIGKQSHPAHPMNRLRNIPKGLSSEYSETQVHGGGVKITDVSHIVWSQTGKSTTPPRAVTTFAKKHGIKVITAKVPSEIGWGIIDLNGEPVQKSVDVVIFAIQHAIQKAFDDVEKGRPRKFSTRTEAAQYAARVRWGNPNGEGGNPSLPPHMQAMKDEADAIRAELADIVSNMDMGNLERSSPKTRPKQWTDEKGAVQIDTASEEMLPSPRLADAHDRVLALGELMVAESLLRVDAKVAEGGKHDLNQLYAESMQAVVSEITPIGGKITLRAVNGGSEKEQEVMTSALQATASRLPVSWVAASANGDLDMEISMRNENPFFREGPERRGYKTSPDIIAFPTPDKIAEGFKSSSLKEITAHEYTHAVESRVPAVKALSIAFVTHRTTGFRLEGQNAPLRERLRTTPRDERSYMRAPNPSTPIMETSRDSFSSLYSGRRYDDATKFDPRAAYARTPNNDRKNRSALEVLTTGVEQYFSGNSGSFDRDHMSFVLGALVTT